MVIRSRFCRPIADKLIFGDGSDVTYEEKIVDGVRKLVQNGKTDSYAFIQKSLDDTLVYNVIAKFERGNVDILNQRVGQFVDVTGLPKTLAEAENIIIKSNNFFDSLPLDIRNRFGNSSSLFLESLSNGSLHERVPELFKTKNNPTKPVVKEGEANE